MDVCGGRAHRALLVVVKIQWSLISARPDGQWGSVSVMPLMLHRLGDERAQGANARQDDEEQLVEKADAKA